MNTTPATTDALFDIPADAPAAPVKAHPKMTAWSSDLVRTLGVIWRVIQKRNPEVPDVVITIASGAGLNSLTLGHFAHSSWQNGVGQVHELMVGAEGLKRGAKDVVQTLLHEAAHGITRTRIQALTAAGVDAKMAEKELNDCSRQGRYHNARFAAVVQGVGLGFPEDGAKPEGYKTLGWSAARMTDETAALYAKEIAKLDEILIAHRRSIWDILAGLGGGDQVGKPQGGEGDGEGDDEGDDAKPAKTYLAAVCRCETPRRIQRIARVVFELADITCDACGSAFVEDVK